MSEAEFQPYGTSVFCEDIRLEYNNRLTLVGVFPAELVLQTIPAFLPKIAALVTLIIPEPSEDKASLRVVLEIYMPGDAAGEPSQTIDQELIAVPPIGNIARDEDIPTHAKIVQRFMISPVEIKATGFIKIRASVDGHLIKAGVLRVTAPQITPPESSTLN